MEYVIFENYHNKLVIIRFVNCSCLLFVYEKREKKRGIVIQFIKIILLLDKYILVAIHTLHMYVYYIVCLLFYHSRCGVVK